MQRARAYQRRGSPDLIIGRWERGRLARGPRSLFQIGSARSAARRGRLPLIASAPLAQTKERREPRRRSPLQRATRRLSLLLLAASRRRRWLVTLELVCNSWAAAAARAAYWIARFSLCIFLFEGAALVFSFLAPRGSRGLLPVVLFSRGFV